MGRDKKKKKPAGFCAVGCLGQQKNERLMWVEKWKHQGQWDKVKDFTLFNQITDRAPDKLVQNFSLSAFECCLKMDKGFCNHIDSGLLLDKTVPQVL